MYQIKDFEERFRDYVPGIQDVRGEFSVLVPLVEKGGALHLLYEVRSAEIGRQPGEVCFPGGEREGAESPVDCALRETWEEIGISREEIRVIAQLDILHLINDVLLYPVLAQIPAEALDHMVLNPAEVAEVFLVPLSTLCEGPYRYPYLMESAIGPDFPYERVGITENYPWRSGKREMLIYHNQGKPVWGLTALITDRLLQKMNDGLEQKTQKLRNENEKRK